MSLRTIILSILLSIFSLAAAARDPSILDRPNSKTPFSYPQMDMKKISDFPLQCVDGKMMSEIKNDPSSIGKEFIKCKAELQKRLGSWNLEEDSEKVIFASIVAGNIAPYGDSSALDFYTILHEKHLNCLNYTAATVYLARELSVKDGEIIFIGLDGGKVGNHAQLLLRLNNDDLLIDPTVGVIAIASYDSLISGQNIPPDGIISFYAHQNDRKFHDVVEWSLLAGAYRPSDVLYVSQNLSDYTSMQTRASALIKGKDADGLRRLFPTAAVNALISAAGK